MHFQIWSFTYIAGYLSCRKTDIEGFLTIYGHSDNLLNNKLKYSLAREAIEAAIGFSDLAENSLKWNTFFRLLKMSLISLSLPIVA